MRKRFSDTQSAAVVLETLTAARLLTIHDSDVAFTHEIVLRAWVRLAGWIDSERASAPIRQRAEADAAADQRQLNDPSLSAQLALVAHHLRPNNQTRSRFGHPQAHHHAAS
jgi:hypothetical protein